MIDVSQLWACVLVALSANILSTTAQICPPFYRLDNADILYDGVLQTVHVECDQGYAEPKTGRTSFTASCQNGAYFLSGVTGYIVPRCSGTNLVLPSPTVGKFCPYSFSFVVVLPNQNRCGDGCSGGRACCLFPKVNGATCAALIVRPRPKDGQCNDASMMGSACARSCTHDIDCPDSQKCCQHTAAPGCDIGGRSCANPAQIGCLLTTKACKRGYICTTLTDRIAECINEQCPAFSRGGCPNGNVDSCLSDAACDTGQACCWDGCRKVCQSLRPLTCEGFVCKPPTFCTVLGNDRVCVLWSTCPRIVIPKADITYTEIQGSANLVARVYCNGQLFSSSTCRNGAWTPAPPASCSSSRCVHNLQVPNGSVKYISVLQAAITCDGAYTIRGPSQVTCSQGQWSPLPTCETAPARLAACGDLNPVPGSALIYNALERSVDTRVQITCIASGKVMYAVCKSTGWEPVNPNIPLSCS